MIFNELYSVYYQTVSEILKAAAEHPLTREELADIIIEHAFEESSLYIEEALLDEKWQLLCRDGTTPIKKVQKLPLTNIQKQWLNAIAKDPRIRLFQEEPIIFPGVEPLFLPEDIDVFDQYTDGDDYSDETYRNNFRLILEAVKKQCFLRIDVRNQRGTVSRKMILPHHMEYSEKDDKFRLIGTQGNTTRTLNLAKIVHCEKVYDTNTEKYNKKVSKETCSVSFELFDERNALERVLMHFAHFKKQVEKVESRYYKVTVEYDKEDETELVIRILSFGPLIKVLEPQHFIDLIKERLRNQKSCEW